MKTVGIVGGIGPESTVEYYRFIIEDYRERRPDGSYPLIVINSVNLDQFLKWINAGDMDSFTDGIMAALETLSRARVDFAVLASNTPHIVFDRIRERSPLPLISIVEATRDRAQALGMTRVGLLGTRFTMQGSFYPQAFANGGLTIVTPNADEQAFIHDKYMSELLKNVFLPETQARLLAVVEQMKERDGIDGLILGGTELPLILRRPEHAGVPFLDTTKIHVERIVAELLA